MYRTIYRFTKQNIYKATFRLLVRDILFDFGGEIQELKELNKFGGPKTFQLLKQIIGSKEN